MKIECVKDKLYKAVLQTEKIVSKNINLPVLSCILFETKDNNLILRSTNLDLAVEVVIPVKVIQQGVVAVPASIISSYLNHIQDNKNIVLEYIDGVLQVSTTTNTTTIHTVPHDDFPSIPKIDGGKKTSLYIKDFQDGVKSVLYSASTSTVKPELSSVYIYGQDGKIVFVATDSFRLAEKIIHTKKDSDIPGVLIPHKNAADILKIFDQESGDIEMYLTKNQISFTAPGLYMVSRVIDGVFPDYKQILPKEEKTKITLLKQDFLNALKVLNIFSDNFNHMQITVSAGSPHIELSTKNQHIGENKSVLNAKIEGESIQSHFNYRYIVEALPSIASDSITLAFNGQNKPLVIQGTSDTSFLYLVMPMNK